MVMRVIILLIKIISINGSSIVGVTVSIDKGVYTPMKTFRVSNFRYI